MPMFEVVAAGWYNDERDELEFDDDSGDTANAEYIATNDEPAYHWNGRLDPIQNEVSDEPYYPDEIGI